MTGLDFTEHIKPLLPKSRDVCELEHHEIIRCTAKHLLGKGGAYDACARDFVAIRKAPKLEDDKLSAFHILYQVPL